MAQQNILNVVFVNTCFLLKQLDVSAHGRCIIFVKLTIHLLDNTHTL